MGRGSLDSDSGDEMYIKQVSITLNSVVDNGFSFQLVNYRDSAIGCVLTEHCLAGQKLCVEVLTGGVLSHVC